MKINIKLKGKIPKLKDFSLAKEIEFHRQVVARLVAEHIREQIKETMDAQSLPWAPLSDAYLAYKKAQGLDTRTLLATKFYYDHIEAWSEGKDRHFVGVRDGVVHEPSGQSLAKIGLTHEYGTKNVPARPLWRPVISRFLRDKKVLPALYNKAKRDNKGNDNQ